jgi:hypothetical protein
VTEAAAAVNNNVPYALKVTESIPFIETNTHFLGEVLSSPEFYGLILLY